MFRKEGNPEQEKQKKIQEFMERKQQTRSKLLMERRTQESQEDSPSDQPKEEKKEEKDQKHEKKIEIKIKDRDDKKERSIEEKKKQKKMSKETPNDEEKSKKTEDEIYALPKDDDFDKIFEHDGTHQTEDEIYALPKDNDFDKIFEEDGTRETEETHIEDVAEAQDLGEDIEGVERKRAILQQYLNDPPSDQWTMGPPPEENEPGSQQNPICIEDEDENEITHSQLLEINKDLNEIENREKKTNIKDIKDDKKPKKIVITLKNKEKEKHNEDPPEPEKEIPPDDIVEILEELESHIEKPEKFKNRNNFDKVKERLSNRKREENRSAEEEINKSKKHSTIHDEEEKERKKTEKQIISHLREINEKETSDQDKINENEQITSDRVMRSRKEFENEILSRRKKQKSQTKLEQVNDIETQKKSREKILKEKLNKIKADIKETQKTTQIPKQRMGDTEENNTGAGKEIKKASSIKQNKTAKKASKVDKENKKGDDEDDNIPEGLPPPTAAEEKDLESTQKKEGEETKNIKEVKELKKDKKKDEKKKKKDKEIKEVNRAELKKLKEKKDQEEDDLLKPFEDLVNPEEGNSDEMKEINFDLEKEIAACKEQFPEFFEGKIDQRIGAIQEYITKHGKLEKKLITPLPKVNGGVIYIIVQNTESGETWNNMTNLEKRGLLEHICSLGDMNTDINLPDTLIMVNITDTDGNVKQYQIGALKDFIIVDTLEEYLEHYEEAKRNNKALITPLDDITEIKLEILFTDKDENTPFQRVKSGFFFPYHLSTTCSELEHYMKPFEIYTYDKWIPRENCFYQSLVNWNTYAWEHDSTNVLQNYELRMIQTRLKGNGVPKSTVRKISEDFDINIQVTTISILKRTENGKMSHNINKQKAEIYGNKDGHKRLIKLTLIMVENVGHYIPDIPTGFTDAGIRNYFDIKRCYPDTPLHIRIKPKTWRKDTFAEWASREEESKLKFLRSGDLIVKMLMFQPETLLSMRKEFFTPIKNYMLYRGWFQGSDCRKVENIDIDTKDYRKITINHKEMDCIIIVADTECETKERHRPYALSYCRLGDDENVHTFLGNTCITQFVDALREICKKEVTVTKGHQQKEVIVYFHNLSYDGRMFCDQHIDVVKKNGNKLIELVLKIGITYVKLRDSLMLIPSKLADFPTMFKTKEKEKKKFPYSFVTIEMVESEIKPDFDDIVESQKNTWNEKDVIEFKESLYEVNAISVDNKVDIVQMVKGYVESDVKILSQGLSIFKHDIKTALNLDIEHYMSISSVAYDYLKRNAFKNNNVYEYTGELRDFIRKAVYGGRCMTRENASYRITNMPLDDIDACSLYPSAMSVMDIPMGAPKKYESYGLEQPTFQTIVESYIEQGHKASDLRQQIRKLKKGEIVDKKEIDKLETEIMSLKNAWNAAILRIKITKVNRKLKFPLIGVKDDKGVLVYDNWENVELFVDDIQFMDLKKWHKIEYELLEAIYWNEGASTDINDCIEKLYNKRYEAKNNKESIEQVYKLIMNSCYGKCIQKPVKYKSVVVEGKNYYKHLVQHYPNTHSIDRIITFDDAEYIDIMEDIIRREMSIQTEDSKDFIAIASSEIDKTLRDRKFLFNEYVTYDDFYIPVIIGVRILSMSKRLMNNVMVPAELNNIEIFYQDTDSMHVDYSKKSELEAAWRKENNKNNTEKLYGKQLCQFHSDFPTVNNKTSIAIRSIFLGKKMYLDILCPIDELDKEEKTIGIMMRMKGIPQMSLLSKEIKLDNKQIEMFDTPQDKLWNMYDKIFEGYSIKFDIAVNKTRILFDKNFTVKSCYSFLRTVNSPICLRHILDENGWKTKIINICDKKYKTML